MEEEKSRRMRMPRVEEEKKIMGKMDARGKIKVVAHEEERGGGGDRGCHLPIRHSSRDLQGDLNRTKLKCCSNIYISLLF